MPYLFRKRKQGIGIQLPASIVRNIPSTEESGSAHLMHLTILAKMYKGEDVFFQICEDIILSYLRLAIKIAGQYASYCPSLSEDFVAEGFIGVTDGVYKYFDLPYKNNTDNNIGGYIVSQIHDKCSRCFDKSMATVRIPRGSYHYLITEGKNTKIEMLPEDFIPEGVEFDFKIKEFLSDIKSICETDEEWSVVLLRMQGLTDAEIAVELGTYRIKILRMREALWKRWQEAIAYIAQNPEEIRKH